MAEEEETKSPRDQQSEEAGDTADSAAKDDDDETLTQVSELNEDKSKQKRAKKGDKKKQFFPEELRRLQESLKSKSSKIQAPPVQKHVPYCFNSLEPYYDTTTAEHVIIKTGDNGKLKDAKPEYATRNTAIGLVDPWVSNKMDHQLGSPVKIKTPQPFKESPKKEKKVGEGSTMIPVFPHVDMDTPDLASRTLNYNDVPKLRKELKEKYSSQGQAKTNSDYERTKVDFYRMELHRLNDVHPVNRGNMKAAYFAYLQNTPGSKKALKECVKEIADEKEDDSKVDNEAKKEVETTSKPSDEEQDQNADSQSTSEKEEVEA